MFHLNYDVLNLSQLTLDDVLKKKLDYVKLIIMQLLVMLCLFLVAIYLRDVVNRKMKRISSVWDGNYTLMQWGAIPRYSFSVWYYFHLKGSRYFEMVIPSANHYPNLLLLEMTHMLVDISRVHYGN